MNEPNNGNPKKISRNEFIEEFGGWLVVIGLIIEVVLALVFHSNEPWYEQWPLVVANVIIVIGVWVEIHFGGNARAEANAKTAEAHERAAILEKEAADAHERTAKIERLTAWRRIGEAEAKELVSSIIPFAEQIDLLIEFQRDDPEAYLFSREIVNIFWRAGVRHMRSSANSYLEGAVFDTWICAAPSLDIKSIVEAFTAVGIDVRQSSTKDLSTHLPRNETAPTVYIFVGPKLPYFLKEQTNSTNETAITRESSI